MPPDVPSPPGPAPDRSLSLPDGVGLLGDEPLPPTTPRRPWLTIAVVLDEFSLAAFEPEARLIPLHASSWEEQVQTESPDLLLVESAFTGPDGSWAHRVARIGDPDPRLRALTEWCRTRGIPTVFWNKEDPPNFAWFSAAASLFDQVFTVDEDTLPRYGRALGHSRLAVLPFAAQPAYHFPPSAPRTGRVAFAGSYYASKHPERLEQIRLVVDPAREYGLHIFDRMGARSDPRFRWPERFVPHIVGSLTYPQVLQAYRLYRVFLNVNTVTDSPTMCARRIFELAACGTPVVSGPSRAIAEFMPDDAIDVVREPEETARALSALFADNGLWQHRADVARNWVLGAHTYGHRLETVLDSVGLSGMGPIADSEGPSRRRLDEYDH